MTIEIKRSSAPELSKGFHLAHEVLKPKEAYLLHGAEETWPMAKGVKAIALNDLMRRLVKE